jgi:ABC-type nitrate/sulfonate/bicarbonate transport system substrate-binding protein
MIQIALFLFLLFASWPQAAPAQTAREKIRVALGSISVNSSVIPIGQQAGLFSRYGIDVEPIYFGGGMNSLAAVTSNSVQFLAAGSTATISARGRGIRLLRRLDAGHAVSQRRRRAVGFAVSCAASA